MRQPRCDGSVTGAHALAWRGTIPRCCVFTHLYSGLHFHEWPEDESLNASLNSSEVHDSERRHMMANDTFAIAGGTISYQLSERMGEAWQ
jgi:hypothetical protein